MKEFVEEYELLEEEKQKEEEILDMQIETLDLSPRPYNCLKKAGYHNIGEVLSLTREQLKALDQLGKKSIDEIEEKLGKIGYRLKEE
jgi:DNA-directed RNA polymerase subunit alpha